MTDEHRAPQGSPTEQGSALVELPPALVSGERPLPVDAYDGDGRQVLRSGQSLPAAADGGEPIASGLYCLAQDLATLFGDAPDAHRSATRPSAPDDEALASRAPARAPMPSQALGPNGRILLTSPWERMLELLAELDLVLHAIAAGRGDAGDALRLARRVQLLCTMDADAALAGLTLLRTREYSVRQSLRVAMLVELMLRRARVGEAARVSSVAAALTMNVGMLDMQNQLYGQREALTEDQRAQIKLHPQRGVELLRDAGVADALWLACVGAHHEHADGTGYPRGIREPEVGVEVQTIALADRYSAMVSERGYRPGAPADRAMSLLLERLGTTISAKVARMLRIEVGDHPPGCIVRLANDEIGVVYRRLREPGARVVKALFSPVGKRYEEGPRRLTTNPRFAITQALTPDSDKLRIDPREIWDAAADPELVGERLAG